VLPKKRGSNLFSRRKSVLSKLKILRHFLGLISRNINFFAEIKFITGTIKCMGVGSGRQGGVASPWIFKHGTDIVDRGLIMLFSVFFAIFRFFFFFSLDHLEEA